MIDNKLKEICYEQDSLDGSRRCYEEQIYIPKEQAKLAEEQGISTENKQKVRVHITNNRTSEYYGGRLAITGNRQLYLPVEVQKLLEGAGEIQIEILGG